VGASYRRKKVQEIESLYKVLKQQPSLIIVKSNSKHEYCAASGSMKSKINCTLHLDVFYLTMTNHTHAVVLGIKKMVEGISRFVASKFHIFYVECF
jgi:hypothetical protein